MPLIVSSDWQAGYYGFGENKDVPSAEMEANAYLIAAAPELLQALRDLLNVIAADDLVPESVSYMKQARAAIAKAEGQAVGK
jgi:hypothetical protein